MSDVAISSSDLIIGDWFPTNRVFSAAFKWFKLQSRVLDFLAEDAALHNRCNADTKHYYGMTSWQRISFSQKVIMMYLNIEYHQETMIILGKVDHLVIGAKKGEISEVMLCYNYHMI